MEQTISTDASREPGGRNLRHTQGQPADSAVRPSRAAKQSAEANQTAVLLTDVRSAAVIGVSVRKFHQLRAESWMPKPRVLGPRCLRWIRSELEQAVINIPRQEVAAPEPAQLLRGKIERLKRAGVSK